MEHKRWAKITGEMMRGDYREVDDYREGKVASLTTEFFTDEKTLPPLPWNWHILSIGQPVCGTSKSPNTDTCWWRGPLTEHSPLVSNHNKCSKYNGDCGYSAPWYELLPQTVHLLSALPFFAGPVLFFLKTNLICPWFPLENEQGFRHAQ